MLKAMRTAVTGMTAQQMNVDNIANNLSNVNTTGFKRTRVEFQDILYQNFRKAGTPTAIGTTIPTNLAIGYGTRPVATVRDFSVGDFQHTGNALDMAISGNGFFQITMPDGTISYTRDGGFKISAEGQVVTVDGFFMYPEINIPEDANSIAVSIDGEVSVLLVGNEIPQTIGQIELARFINPAGLSAIGHNLYNQTPASGAPIVGNPAEEGLGKIDQGYLEISNVKVVDEMVNMIVAQRAYELNSKVIQTSEDMLQISNNLKR
ncbi:MAG: flagellar basal-body rod protein FlgG [Candidatus Zixiibacteriota bacterium]|nr:MAG: flagellar basal-body rod protein FlgG [candidate division Zixibacteria bacterium]